jgi:uncharacterized membrane protein
VPIEVLLDSDIYSALTPSQQVGSNSNTEQESVASIDNLTPNTNEPLTIHAVSELIGYATVPPTGRPV